MNDPLRAFWTRADSDIPSFTGDEVRRWPGSIWQVLKAHSIVQRSENLDVVECDACGDQHAEAVEVLIEPAGSEPRAYISCPVAGRVTVPWYRLEAWRIDFDAVANWTARALNLDAPPQMIVQGRVWLLGRGSFGSGARDFFLVRGAHWSDAHDVLASAVRLDSAPCPVIFCPRLLPTHPAWREKGHVVLSMAEFHWFRDDAVHMFQTITEVLTGYEPRTPALPRRTFRKEGQYWTVLFEQRVLHFRHTKGMFYLSFLLNNPGREHSAIQLFAAAAGSAEIPQNSSAGEVLDARALSNYQSRAAEIEDELQKARQNNDIGRREALHVELDSLAEQITAAKGLGGRSRNIGDKYERDRKAVAEAVRRAIRELGREDADLAKHLNNHVSLGAFVSYAGDNNLWNS